MAPARNGVWEADVAAEASAAAKLPAATSSVRVSGPLPAVIADGSGVAVPAVGASPAISRVVSGRSAISYADVAAFEAGIASALRKGYG